jgi:fumarate reductase flavoprotein subunit
MASSWQEPYDVVVVGGGMTGSAAAGRAAELGSRVLLVDGGQDPTAGGNTPLAGGGLHIARARLDADPEVLREKILDRAILPRRDLIEMMVTNAGRAFAWMLDQGVKLEAKAPGDIECMFAPMRDLGDLHSWRGAGPQMALKAMQARFIENGGQVMAGAPVRELAVGAKGKLDGVIIEDGRRILARSVMISDGGFQANPELRRRLISKAADRMFLRGAATGNGTGLTMGESLGAKLANTQWFYGHLMHRDVFKNDRLWPYPSLDELRLHGAIVVDPGGQRFVDEGRSASVLVNGVGQSADPAGATVIMDARMWDGAKGEWVWGHRAANPELIERGARIIRAQSAEELAAAANIDAEGLIRTLDMYGTAAGAGKTGNLPVPRSGDTRPFEGELVAIPAVAGITHTMGGLLTDDRMRVLDGDARAIPGLYAAGPSAAGPTVGYFGGLATALVSGLVAGETAALEFGRNSSTRAH